MKKILILTVIFTTYATFAFSQNVTISFFQESLPQALNDLATQENLTVLTDSTVGGFITLNLNNVSISQALDLMLLPGGYSWKKISDGVYFVGTANPTSNSFLYLATSTVYNLRYVSAGTVMSLLPAVVKGYVFTSRTSPNTLLIGAPAEIQPKIVSMIEKIDLPKPEIVVQANILEVDDTLARQWGMDLQYSPSGNSSSNTINILNDAINLLYTSPNLSILSNIRANESNGAAKILASPKLRIESGKNGTVKVNTARQYPYIDSNGTQAYATVNVGIDLSITPTVSASGEVSLDMSETVNGAMNGSNSIPDTMSNTFSTTFNTAAGKTVAVGGVNFNTYEKTTSKVPILGDMPVIGYLFTNEGVKKVKKDIIVVVTVRKAGD